MIARKHAGEAAVAVALALASLIIARSRGVVEFDAVPVVARGVAAFALLICVAGYAPARLLVAPSLWPHFAILVPLVGSASAGIGLTALGFLGVPFSVSLPVLLVVLGVLGVVVRLKLGPARPSPEQLAAAGGRRLTLAWPAYLAVLIIALLVTPIFANGFASVQGQNPDGLMGVGTAEFLQHAHPTAIAEELPVDRMPPLWRSKYPIYYALAGGSSLGGLDPTRSFAAISAVLAALTAAGYMLVARYALRTGPHAGVAAMAVVGLSGTVTYLALHPYHNQLWGTLALAPILLFGLRFVQRPSGRDAALLGGFLALGLAAYPLMVMFPALGLAGAGAAALRQRRGNLSLRWRRPRLPRSARGWAALVLAIAIAAPAALVVGDGITEKSVAAVKLLAPGSNLGPWRGDLTTFLPVGFFVGVKGALGAVVAVALLGAAVLGVRRFAPVQRACFAAMLTGGLLFAAYFRLRTSGDYLYFKLLAFVAPLVLVAAVAWVAAWGASQVARGARRAIVPCAAVAVLALQMVGLQREIVLTSLQLDTPILELQAAAERLPKGASVRVDALTDGRQLWVAYVLSEHPLTTLNPLLGTTYPSMPVGRRADYIVADTRIRVAPWPDADGPPLFDNGSYRLYRMRAGVPGPDVSSRLMNDFLAPPPPPPDQ